MGWVGSAALRCGSDSQVAACSRDLSAQRADCPRCSRPLGVRQMPQTCALVSTSGGLLAERHGRAIDAATIVARIGSAPLSKELERHVGRRTTVRLIPTSFFTTSSGRTNHSHRIGAKMNHTHMHGVIADMEPDAEVVFMVRLTDPAFAGTAWREKSGGCPTRVTEFMAQHPRTRVRCISAKLSQCRWPFRVPSGGFVALAVLFERYQCETVRLYGFANANASLPYHYWSEGSLHDGVSTRDWYGRRSKVHNFTHEHLLMHDVLGRCSWHATATRYREYCRKQESSAYANSRRCAGGGAASAIVEHQDERNVRSASCHTNAPASAAAAPPLARPRFPAGAAFYRRRGVATGHILPDRNARRKGRSHQHRRAPPRLRAGP